jgi:hypothetical protein
MHLSDLVQPSGEIMTHHRTDSRLLTYALTPWNRGALLRVSPVIAQSVWLGKQGIWMRLVDGFKTALQAGKAPTLSVKLESTLSVPIGQLGESRNGEHDGGCKICRSANFEIGAVSSGQEYL